MVTRYNNTLEIIENTFSKFSSEPAFSCVGHTISFSEVDRLSRKFASYLQHDLGLAPGDRVAIQLPNILQYPVVIYGAIRAGVVIVNVNPLYTPREIKHQLCDSGAKVLVVLSNVARNAADIIDETDVETVIVTDFADLHPLPKKWLINFVLKYVKKAVPPFSFSKSIKFSQILASREKPLRELKVNKEDLIFLQYTGGTTGLSKGAMLTHHNMASNVWQLISCMPQAFHGGENTFAACLPLYHIYALNLHAFGAFSCGCHNILIPNPRDISSIVKVFKDYKIDIIVGINTLYIALSQNEEFKKLDFSNLKISTGGGMAITENAAENWESITGCKINEGYGLTETSPVVAANNPNCIKLGTIGNPAVDTEVKVVNPDGDSLPVGEVGELCVRGPQVMKGYWNKPEETAKVLSDDGWFKTGDMAKINKDGTIKIVDRKKDMVLVSGFNVYPNEVEEVVTKHPDIVEAAVIGVPDERSGEAVKLFVVSTNKDLSQKNVEEYCREHLAAYKVPKIVEFRENLPKSTVGKILRRELR